MLTSHFKYWAAFSVLAIAAVSLTWWDASDVLHSVLGLVAAVTGLMYTMLAGRGHISCYAFGFVHAPLYAYLSWRWGYYGDMALNVYYVVMMVSGLVCWRKNMDATDKGCIEQWVLWLAVDAIEMFMWWHTGADSMAILAMWTLFFVDGCYCYALWLTRPD